MSTTKVARKKGKKNRKFGRNSNFCLRYRNEDRRAKNKARRVRKHVAKFPNDKQAQKFLADR
jgi:hypothetical protein